MLCGRSRKRLHRGCLTYLLAQKASLEVGLCPIARAPSPIGTNGNVIEDGPTDSVLATKPLSDVITWETLRVGLLTNNTVTVSSSQKARRCSMSV